MIKETIVDGFHNAPHRSLYHALGLTDEEQARPLIGVVCSYNEIVPGHMNLDKICDKARRGDGGRYAYYVPRDHRLRRDCNGAYGYEILARHP